MMPFLCDKRGGFQITRMDVGERGKARTFCGGPEGSGEGKVKKIIIIII